MADSGRLDAVIHGVADHMQQGILEMLKDSSVHFNVGADHLQSRQFVMALRDVADGTGELLKQRSHWYQAYIHYLFLQDLLQDLSLAMQFEKLASGIAFEIFDHPSQTTLGNGNLAGKVQHAIEFVGVDAKRAVPGSRRRGTRNRSGGGHLFRTEGSLRRRRFETGGMAGDGLFQLLMRRTK